MLPGEVRLPAVGELTSGWLSGYQVVGINRGTCPSLPPLISSSIMEIFPFKGYNNHQLGLEQVCRKVSPVSGVWVKQALVRQGWTESKRTDIFGGLIIYSTHIPCITFTILVHSSSAAHLGSGM